MTTKFRKTLRIAGAILIGLPLLWVASRILLAAPQFPDLVDFVVLANLIWGIVLLGMSFLPDRKNDKAEPMKFFFHPAGPDENHPTRGVFTRHITAFTLEDPRDPGRPAFLNLGIPMTQNNQGIDIIKQAIEEKVGAPIKLAGGYTFQNKQA